MSADRAYSVNHADNLNRGMSKAAAEAVVEAVKGELGIAEILHFHAAAGDENCAADPFLLRDSYFAVKMNDGELRTLRVFGGNEGFRKRYANMQAVSDAAQEHDEGALLKVHAVSEGLSAAVLDPIFEKNGAEYQLYPALYQFFDDPLLDAESIAAAHYKMMEIMGDVITRFHKMNLSTDQFGALYDVLGWFKSLDEENRKKLPDSQYIDIFH